MPPPRGRCRACLHTQYLPAASPTRRSAPSRSSLASARSSAAASRIASTVAASDSIARSASTCRISGWSINSAPNARRCAVWRTACRDPERILAAEAMTQSSRVTLTISTMVRIPRPSSPTGQPTACSYSISADVLERLPNLSLSRCRRRGLRLPSGSTRGSRKHVSPLGACARVRNTSLMGAEVNHLCPVITYVPSPVGVAVVVPCRTSEPPCFSVIDMPAIRPCLPSGGRSPKSYVVEASNGSYAADSSGSARSAGIAAYVMEIGHPWPGLACAHR